MAVVLSLYTRPYTTSAVAAESAGALGLDVLIAVDGLLGGGGGAEDEDRHQGDQEQRGAHEDGRVDLAGHGYGFRQQPVGHLPGRSIMLSASTSQMIPAAL